MGKLTKNQKLAAEKIEAGKAYSLKEASELVKEITFTQRKTGHKDDFRKGCHGRGRRNVHGRIYERRVFRR